MNVVSSIRVRAGCVVLALTLFAVCALTARSTTNAFQPYAVVNMPFTPITYSIQTFLWWDYTEAARHMDWVRTMVFSDVKQIFAWEDLEPARGQWDFRRSDEILGELERRNLRLIVRLSDAPDWAHPSVSGRKNIDFVDAPPDDLPDFAAYCGAIASRYPGRIHAYQVWNEPNLSREWGNQRPNVARYVEMLGACSEAIRDADPGAIIISAGLSPTGNNDDRAIRDDLYLQELYDLAFQRYIDVVGVHAPGFSAPELSPIEAEAQGTGRWFTFRRVEDMRRIMVSNGDAARQIAILEFGWTTDRVNPDYAWFAVDEDTQASNLVAAYRFAADNWRPWVGLMSAIYMPDPSWTEEDEEYWWSVMRPPGYTLPAYMELANMAKYCGERVIPARAPDSPEALGLVVVDPCD